MITVQYLYINIHFMLNLNISKMFYIAALLTYLCIAIKKCHTKLQLLLLHYNYEFYYITNKIAK